LRRPRQAKKPAAIASVATTIATEYSQQEHASTRE
jgi:hypothetical protein